MLNPSPHKVQLVYWLFVISIVISVMAKQAHEKIRTVAFVSLGCPKNLIDSEKMLGLLAQDGIAVTPDHAHADAIVINTCGFLEASKTESLQVIREAIEQKKRGGAKNASSSPAASSNDTKNNS